MTNDAADRHYVGPERLTIAFLSLYCLAVGIGAFTYLFLVYDDIIDVNMNAPANSTVLLQMIVAVGVLGSVLRAVESLVSDVGRGSFFSRWSLSILMRPLEGAIMAVIVFFAVSWFLSHEGNSFGFMAIAGVAGMFSHNVAAGLTDSIRRLVGTGRSQNVSTDS